MLAVDQSKSFLVLILVGFILSVAIFQDQILPQPGQDPESPAGAPESGPAKTLFQAGVAEATAPAVTEPLPCTPDPALEALKKDIEGREIDVETREKNVAEREKVAAAQEEALAGRGDELDKLERDLADKAVELAGRETEVERREKLVGDAEVVLEDGWRRQREQQARLDAQWGELVGWEERLLERERQLDLQELLSFAIAGAGGLVGAGALAWLAWEKRGTGGVRPARQRPEPIDGRLKAAVLRRVDGGRRRS